MPLFTQLAKLIYFLPCVILSIVILDLIRNRSLVTQYLHWTVYVLVGTTGAIFTGKMQNPHKIIFYKTLQNVTFLIISVVLTKQRVARVQQVLNNSFEVECICII